MVKINDDSRGTWNTNSQVKFKISTPKSDLRDYSDERVFVKGAIKFTEGPADASDSNKSANNRNKEIIFKNSASFTDSLSKVNNTQIENSKDLAIVIRSIIQ